MNWPAHANLWHAAAENVWRQPGKTVAVFVPLLVAVTVFSALSFMRDGMVKDALDATGGMPDLTVQATIGGRVDRLPAAVGERIARMDGVTRVAPRVWGFVPVTFGRVALTYTLMGIDPARMPRPEAIGLSVERGRFLNETDTDGAVIGKAVAESLGVQVGDALALKDDLGNAARFRVVGIFAGDVQIHAADLIVTTAPKAREFFGYRGDEATDLCVYLADPAAADAIASGIQSSARGTRVLSRATMRDVVQRAYGARAGVFQLVWMILLLTAALVAWVEASHRSLRTDREIGILKATGWSTSDVIEMKVFENALLAVVATLGGMLLGLGYVVAGAPGIKSYFLGWAVVCPDVQIPVQVTAATAGTILAIGIFPLLVATIIPAWAAGIIDPDEAMRG